MSLAWTLTSHPLVDHYLAVLSADSAEVTRIDLGFEGSDTTRLDATTLAACTPSCTASLYPVDADGGLGVLLFETSLGLDVDGDGYLSGLCGGPDCGDADATVNPDGVETCDSVDNDCNGIVDDLPSAPLADLQQGVCAGAVKICDGAGGWTEPDYADHSADYATTETCDGLDNTCNGVVDDLTGAPLADVQLGVCAGAIKACDGSGGWTEPDYTAITGYEATEATCDGLDNDCNDAVDEMTPPAADLQAGVCAGAVKSCAGAGWQEPNYADHSDDYAVYDDCDGLNNDCVDGVDDPVDPPLADQDGVCVGSKMMCNGTSWVDPVYTDITGYELVEVSCDGLDNDCNGSDDDLAADLGALAAKQHGVCLGARETCSGGQWGEPDYSVYSPAYATTEDCDGLDNDCNNLDDDIQSGTEPLALEQEGVCAGAVQVCGESGWEEPNYGLIANYEPVEETCDGFDNDCDTVIDTVYQLDPDSSTLECWGSATLNYPTRIDDGPWKAVFAQVVRGDSHACGTDMSDQLYCWGANRFGQLGDGTLTQRRAIRPVAGTASWSEVVLTEKSSCGLQLDGTLWCWGASPEPGGDNILVPTQVGTGTWTDLSAGDLSACLIGTDESLWCWGDSKNGLLGPNYSTDQPAPVLVHAGTWRAVSVGGSFACAIDTNDGLSCWGSNWSGEIGLVADSGAHPNLNPVAHPAGGMWDQVSTGAIHACALDVAGAAWCWGSNGSMQLGDGTWDDNHVPNRVSAGPWVSISSVGDSTCTTDAAGAVSCWGFSLGMGTQADSAVPELLGADFASFGQGLNVGCGVSSTDASLWCWGGAYEWGTGPGPEQVVLATDKVVRSFSTDMHTCFIDDADGALWCGGDNQMGQLGNGTQEPTVSPEFIHAGPFTEVHVSGFYSLALDVNQKRWGWGRNDRGTVGDGTTDRTVLTPWQDSSTSWQTLSLGAGSVCGLALDNSLWCWGDGFSDATSPAQLGTEQWTAVDVGSAHHCAIDLIGDLFCWGQNQYGKLGDGSTTNVTYATRAAVAEAGPWRDVEAATTHTCAVKQDDTLWCWGYGRLGALGNGQTTDSSIPVQVPGAWASVALGSSHTCAVNRDGETWCWGYNAASALQRDIDLAQSSVPVQVEGTGWTAASAGAGRVCGTRATYGEVVCDP